MNVALVGLRDLLERERRTALESRLAAPERIDRIGALGIQSGQHVARDSRLDHVDSSTGIRHWSGSGSGSGGGTVDPGILYGIGYATTILGAAFTTGFLACGEGCGASPYLYPALMFGASELAAIIGVVVEGGVDFLQFGILTGLNVAGVAFDILGTVLFAEPEPLGPSVTHLSIGPAGLSLGGSF